MTPLPAVLSSVCRLQNDRCTPEGNVLNSSAYRLAERTTSLSPETQERIFLSS